MRILVVGGAGYIGSHVVLNLLETGHQVTVFDNFSTGREENLFEGAHLVRGDLLVGDDLSRTFEAACFDAVIHLAALKFAGDSMREPDRYAHHNITGSIHLLNLTLRHRVPFFVFSSSAAVYGDPEYLPIDEAHPIHPVNFYGFTKLEIERILEWYARLSDLRFVALRYFNAAGYDPRGRVRGLEQRPQNLIPVAMEAVLGRRPRLEIFGDDYDTPDGTCIRDYIHVSDLAAAHTLALDYLSGSGANLVVNLGSEQGHSVLEVVRTAGRVTGLEIPHVMVGRRSGDPATLVAAAQQARDVLGWQPRHMDLEVMLRTTWDVYRH